MDVIRPVMQAELLILDDLGAERLTDWVEETMNVIVNSRYNAKLPTIFTSNYEDIPGSEDMSSLLVRVGFRLHSRLREMCEFPEYDGPDTATFHPTPMPTTSTSCGRDNRAASRRRARRRPEPTARTDDGSRRQRFEVPGGRAGS
jgi:hypothetical protein